MADSLGTTRVRRLVLVEPSLKYRVGHEQAHARALAAECKQLNISFEVLASRDADDDILDEVSVRKTFRFDIFSRIKHSNPIASLSALRSGSRSCEQDFCAAFDELRVTSDDLLLLNTVRLAVLFGYLGWLANQPAEVRPGTAIILRLGAEEGLPGAMLPRLSRWLYRRVLNTLHELLRCRLFLATDTRLIGEEFERLIRRTVADIPLPIAVPEAVPPRASRDAVHIVFPLPAALERGFHLLPDALAVALARCPRLIATVRVVRPGKGSRKRIARLKAMAPRVRLMGGDLNDHQFYDLLNEADGVLLTHHPVIWAKRSSQILAQTAALGRPVIVIAGSFLDYECRTTGIASITAEAFEPESLAAAIEQFVIHRDQLCAAAWRSCAKHRGRHSATAFVDRLLQFAASSADANEPGTASSRPSKDVKQGRREPAETDATIFGTLD